MNARCWPTLLHPYYTVLAPMRRGIAGMAKRICKSPKSKIIDLGCGDRPYEELFAINDAEYIGCDIVQKPGQLLLVEGQKIPFENGAADAVVSFQVLEHVWNIDWYLKEARRVLKKNGNLVLSTHGNWPYHPCPGDYRRWTRDGLIREIESRGFAHVETVPVLGPLAYSSLMRLLGIHQVASKLGRFGQLVAAPFSLLFNLLILAEDAITPHSFTLDNASVYLMRFRPR